MISHTCQLSHSIDQIIAFDRGCLSITNSFSEISETIAITHILLKLHSLEYIFVEDIWVYLPPLLCNWPPKLPNLVLGRTAQNNGQQHSVDMLLT